VPLPPANDEKTFNEFFELGEPLVGAKSA